MHEFDPLFNNLQSAVQNLLLTSKKNKIEKRGYIKFYMVGIRWKFSTWPIYFLEFSELTLFFFFFLKGCWWMHNCTCNCFKSLTFKRKEDKRWRIINQHIFIHLYIVWWISSWLWSKLNFIYIYFEKKMINYKYSKQFRSITIYNKIEI